MRPLQSERTLLKMREKASGKSVSYNTPISVLNHLYHEK